MKRKTWIVLIAILCLLVGFGFGMTYGFSKGVAWAVHIGLNFVDIEVDEEMLVQGIRQYKNRIEGCFDGTLNFTDTRNSTMS